MLPYSLCTLLCTQSSQGYDDVKWEADEDQVNLALMVVPLSLILLAVALGIALIAIVAYKVKQCGGGGNK